MTVRRTTEPSVPLHADAPHALEVPGWESDRRELERRSQDRLRKWCADNAIALVGIAASGALAIGAMLGLRMEGAPEDLARFKVQAANDQIAIVGRVGKVENVVEQLLDDNRDLKAAVKEQRYLLCYIIRKQDPGAAGAIESCAGVKAP